MTRLRSSIQKIALCGLALVLYGCLCASVSIGYGEVEEEWRGEVERLSWSPRAFVLKGFLTDVECDHIIKVATPKMVESEVVDSATGGYTKDDVRTSTGTFFDQGEDEVIARIEKRVAQVTMIPAENQEGMQVLHYRDGQKYEAHNDYFHDDYNKRPENGGQRVLTVLMYLTTPEEGGETVFPEAERKVSGPDWSPCAQQGLALKAKRGDAIMFYSLKPDGSLDPSSLHGSCPTTKGDKWSATKWIHVGKFIPPGEEPQAAAHSEPIIVGGDGCEDSQGNCAKWAASGECENNPVWMLANCKLSCKTCTQPGAASAA